MDTNNMARKAAPIRASGLSRRCRHFADSSRWRSYWKAASLVLSAFIVALGLWLPAAHADDVAYVYDELGRLVQATNSTSGEAVLYTYDEVGNITSQRTLPLTTLTIGHCTPSKGPVGTQVAIHGTGFSAVPAANTVRFNGVAATVISASSTQIVAVVPSSATTGNISVEVGAGTTTSSDTFAVTATTDGPAISSVAANIAPAGAIVTILGTNFDPSAINNRVRLNNSIMQVTGATTTSITVLVPANTGSGRIRVTTPRGVVVSPSDFIVLPTGYGIGNIGPSGRVETDGSAAAVVLPGGSKAGLRLFEGVAGDLLTIGINSTTFANCTIKVFGPDAALLVSGSVTAAGQGVQIPKLAKTGTYTIVTDAGANAGTVSLGVYKPLTSTVTVDGPGNTVTLTPPGRRALLTFSGAQGTYANVDLTAVSVSAGKVTISTPTGAELVSRSFTTSGMQLQPYLPSTGNYVALIDPTGSVGGSATLSVAASSTPALNPNSGVSTINFTNSTPQSVTFRGEPGQYMSLVAYVQSTSASFVANVEVRNPDGTQLSAKTVATSYVVGSNRRGSKILNMGPLQQGGTYTVVVQRTASVTGSVELTLSTASTGAIASNGATAAVSISRAGQSIVRSFSGAAGESLSFEVSERTGFITGTTVTVLNPDGSIFTSDTFAPPLGDGGVIGGGSDVYRDGGRVVNFGPLSVSGTYRVLLQQLDSSRKEDDYTGTLKLTLAKPVTGVIGVNGGSVSTSISNPGQGLRYTFAGTAGQYLALGMSSNLGRINAAAATVLDPTGAAIAAGGMIVITSTGGDLTHTFGSTVVNLGPLAMSGTYTVLVNQAGSNAESTGTIDLTLSTPLNAAIGSSSTHSNLEIERPGQGVLFSFSGSASQYLAFHVYAHGWINAARMTVLDPSGAAIATGTMPTESFAAIGGSGIGGYEGNAVLSFGPLPVTGSYFILFEQTGSGAENIGPLTVQMTAPQSGSLSGSATHTIDIEEPGQGGLYTFSANAGDYRALVIKESNGRIKSAVVSILNSQGASIVTGNLTTTASGSGANITYSGRLVLNVGPLPATDTYRVLIAQNGQGAGETGTLSMTFSQPVGGSVTVGSSVAVSVALPGQGILHTFTGTAGQHLSLTVSEAIGSYISNASIKVLNPDGTALRTATLTATNCPSCGNSFTGSTTITTGPLPASGAYGVLVQQTALAGDNMSVGTGELSLALTELSPGTGSSTSVNTSTPGQTATINFNAVAGQNMAVGLTGLILAPNAGAANITVYKPGGGALDSVNCSPGGVYGGTCAIGMVNMPETGTYSAVVTPPAGATMSFTFSVTQAVTGLLAPNSSVNVNMAAIGQYALLSFTATAGQTFLLNVGSISTTPANQNVWVQIYNPAGTVIASGGASTQSNFNLANLTAGTYRVFVAPYNGILGSVQIRLVEAAKSSALVGANNSLSTSVPSQAVQYTFAGTTGQNLAVGMTGLTLTPNSGSANLVVYKPDGNSLDSVACSPATVSGACGMALMNLAQTGTYTAVITPPLGATMNGTFLVSQAVTGALTPGTPVNVSTSGIGQYALLSFAVTVGQKATVTIGSVATTPANQNVWFQIQNSAGTVVASGGTSTGINFHLNNLAAGTYQVFMSGYYGLPASAQIKLVSSVEGTVPSDGSGTTFSTTASSQPVYISFAGMVGENLSVGMSSLTLSPNSGQAKITVYKPDGSPFETVNCNPATYGGTCGLALINLPQTGNYDAVVTPTANTTMNFTFVVSRALTSPLTVGAPMNLSMTSNGQYALLPFTATAGQTFALHLSAATTIPANDNIWVQVYNPAGAIIASGGTNSRLTFNLSNLTEGTHRVFVGPYYGLRGSAQIRLVAGVQATLPADGSGYSFNTSVPSQAAYFSFAGTVGQNLSVGMSGLTLTPNSGSATITVYKPDGATFNSVNCNPATIAGSCGLPLINLPQTGNYVAVVTTNAATTMSSTFTVAQAVTGALLAGTPVNVNMTANGQYALLSFTATAGQTFALHVNSVATIPANENVWVQVYGPTWAVVTNGGTSTQLTFNLTNLAAGTYRVFVGPYYGILGSAQIQLVDGL